jgi:phenazine biosynthesis protein phzE
MYVNTPAVETPLIIDGGGGPASPPAAEPTRLGPRVVVGHTDDPTDHGDPSVALVRAVLWRLLHERKPFLAVCLGHEVLSELLGFELVRRPAPDGGRQGSIDVFGRRRQVRFDNTFVALSERQQVRCLSLGGMIEVCRDPRSGEVHALRGPGFLSVQFHPESLGSLTV